MKPVLTSTPEQETSHRAACKRFHLDGPGHLGGPVLSHKTEGVWVLESHLEDSHGLISGIHFRFPNVRNKFLSQLSHYVYSGVIRYSSWYFTHTNVPLIYPFSAVAIPLQALRKHVGITVIRWGQIPLGEAWGGGCFTTCALSCKYAPFPRREAACLLTPMGRFVSERQSSLSTAGPVTADPQKDNAGLWHHDPLIPSFPGAHFLA